MKTIKLSIIYAAFAASMFIVSCTSNTSQNKTNEAGKSDTDTIVNVEQARPAENAPVKPGEN